MSSPSADPATPKLHGAARILRRLAEAAMAASLLGMVLAVFLNVVLRYFFNTGLALSEELSRLLFVWLVCIGAVLALAEGKHLGFDMVSSRLRGPSAAACAWITRALMAVVLYFLIAGSWQQVLAGLDSRSPVMNYPLALAAAGPLVMGVAMAAVLLVECVTALHRSRAIAPCASHTD